MWYDWLVGGWGGRNGKDGTKRLACLRRRADGPARGRTGAADPDHHHLPRNTARLRGPGQIPRRCGVLKGGTLTEADDRSSPIAATASARSPSGIKGGLPGYPHGAWLNAAQPSGMARRHVLRRADRRRGTNSPARPPAAAALATRSSATRRWCEDVIDEYVSIERARKDYGVVIEAIDPEDLRVRDRRCGDRAGAGGDPRQPPGLAEEDPE